MRPIYIFDLDGTLRNAEHRLHLIPDWRAFFAACGGDKPIRPTIRTFQILRDAGAECWIWSGCSNEVLETTKDWLIEHDVLPELLVMRKAGDHRPDHVVKKEWLDALTALARERVVAVFEDRDRVVQMWREAGLTCYQVAPGDF